MTELCTLGALLTNPRPRGAAADLRADIQRASAWLQQQPTGKVALYVSDSRLFTTWLLAGWQTGRCVMLPGDATPHTEEQLLAAGALLLGDFHQAACRDLPSSSATIQLPPALSGQPAVEVFTSGSTGTPTRIGKTLRQLDAEIQALEQVLGTGLSCQTEFLSTVSHQHLYGLLFSILWPLARGQHLLTETVRYPEELLRRSNPFLLLSSPAFLKRLPQELEWSRAPSCRAVISSGGALPTTAAQTTRECLGVPVTEIYGSSETGGIAHRHDPQAPWTPQPGVELRLTEAGCLAVRSPFLPDDNWFVTADRGRLEGTCFHLEGRTDRIVKIEEKRVSLTALENSLHSSPWIAEARVVPLEGPRTVLGAALTLTPAGEDELAQRGKAEFTADLRRILATQFERIALPRRWRIVSQLPVNTMGKTTDHALLALFATRPRWPRVLSRTATETGIRLTLELTPELAVFEGHFPQLPILPGVAQLDWALHFATEYLDLPGEFSGMEAIKFQKLTLPGQPIELSLDYNPAKRQLLFRYQSTAGQHASGRIRLHGESA